MARPKPLKAEDVLKIVSAALARGRVYPSNHFRQRMRERNFDINDSIQVLENAGEARPKRKAMGASAKELAKLLGVTTVTISRWENNKEKIGAQSDRLLRCLYLTRSKGLSA